MIRVPFDRYRFPKGFKWEYTFYKLKVLEYMVNESNYDCLLSVDTDTYFSGSVLYLWDEYCFDHPFIICDCF